MKLYYSSGACSLASHIALEETGLPFEKHAVDFDNGESETPQFLKMNPIGAVPVLIMENGESLTEGAAILQYIADRKPELGLAPKQGTPERYRLQEKLNFISTEIHKNFGPLFALSYISKEPAVQESVRGFFVHSLGVRFDILESLLSKQDYL